MSNTYQDENGDTQFGDRKLKTDVLGDIILMMVTHDITYQDFLDYIEKGSQKYEALRNLDFKDQSAVLQELAQKLFTEDNHPGNLYRRSPDFVRIYEARAEEILEGKKGVDKEQ